MQEAVEKANSPHMRRSRTSAGCPVRRRKGVMDSVTSRQTSVQVPDERVRNSTGLAVRPLFSPSQIQRAKGVIPNRNSAGLTRPTASADHWTLGVAASRRVSAAVEAWGAGAPVRAMRASVIGLQVHALVRAAT